MTDELKLNETKTADYFRFEGISDDRSARAELRAWRKR